MIYQSYNFVDSYSNASGNRKHSMVLGELGKVIHKEPKAVIDALKDAGVKVPANSSRKDLVRLIIANKRNKRLIQNLSVLITASATTLESYSNMMDDDKLAPLPATAGGSLTANSPKELAGTKKGGFLQSIGQFFQKRKQGKELDPTKKASAEEESGFQRFAKWFTKNRDTIGQVATTLNNSLGSANAGSINTGGDGGDGGGGATSETWIQRNKTLVIVGLVVVAGGIYFMSKRKGKK